jgi:hypothetical protein
MMTVLAPFFGITQYMYFPQKKKKKHSMLRVSGAGTVTCMVALRAPTMFLPYINVHVHTPETMVFQGE